MSNNMENKMDEKHLKTKHATKMTLSVPFKKDHQKIIENCRSFDKPLNDLRQALDANILVEINEESLDVYAANIRAVSQQFNDLKSEYKAVWYASLEDRRGMQWLHVEFVNEGTDTSKYKGMRLFQIMTNWRLGSREEKRRYCSRSMLEYDVFYELFNQEIASTQLLILEFERIRMLMLILTRNIKFKYLACIETFEQVKSLQKLQALYHEVLKNDTNSND